MRRIRMRVFSGFYSLSAKADTGRFAPQRRTLVPRALLDDAELPRTGFCKAHQVFKLRVMVKFRFLLSI